MQSLANILDNDKAIRRARLLDEMTQCICRHLPPPLNTHCRVTGHNDKTLFLVADTGGYATMVYCHQHQLLKQFNTEFRQGDEPLRKVQVRAAPPDMGMNY